MDPSHSGRVDKNKQKPNKGFIIDDSENPMYNIKRVFEQIDKMKNQEQQIKDRGFSQAWDFDNAKQIRKDIEKARLDLVRLMKMNFKHINGMLEARNPNTFLSEVERYETVKVDKIIEKKILVPSQRVIDCMRGVENLFEIQNNFDTYMINFKQPVKKVVI